MRNVERIDLAAELCRRRDPFDWYTCTKVLRSNVAGLMISDCHIQCRLVARYVDD